MAESDDWDSRNAALWAAIDDYGIDEEGGIRFRAAMDALVGELPEGSGIGSFERASALDSTGHSDHAVPLYRAALEAGLTGERRRRAVIQMSSSLRNLGRPQLAVHLLAAEREAETSILDDAVIATLALALIDVGREREAAALAIAALARHLPRYQRSMANYARLVMDPEG
jgi:hypothetical protein